ncbi:MAG: hypothetical protein AAGJ82_00060 [Bacteroidota bacterium]
MPWHILLPFLLLGILVGASQWKETKKKTKRTVEKRSREQWER